MLLIKVCGLRHKPETIRGQGDARPESEMLHVANIPLAMTAACCDSEIQEMAKRWETIFLPNCKTYDGILVSAQWAGRERKPTGFDKLNTRITRWKSVILRQHTTLKDAYGG